MSLNEFYVRSRLYDDPVIESNVFVILTAVNALNYLRFSENHCFLHISDAINTVVHILQMCNGFLVFQL